MGDECGNNTLRPITRMSDKMARGYKKVTAIRWLDGHNYPLETHSNITEYVLAVNNSDGTLALLSHEERARFVAPVEVFWKKGLSWLALPTEAFNTMGSYCKTLLSQRSLLDYISRERFNVAIVDLLYNECSLLVAHVNEVPVIGYWGMSFTGLETGLTAAFNAPSSIPSILSRNSHEMTFMQRMHNFIYYFISKAVMQYLSSTFIPHMRRFQPDCPTSSELLSNISGALINSDYALDYPRALPPTYINIGGLQLRDLRPLPKDLEDFMNSSGEDGVVVFTMGSIFDPKVIPAEVLSAFMEAFRRLKQKVLFKLNTDVADTPPNVKIMKWIPQQDVLGHPKTKAFITHCGMHGVLEALYHGVPMVGMPIFIDQGDVMTKMLDKGVAVGIEKGASEDEIYNAVTEVLSNSKYRENAKKVSLLLRDRTNTPMERATLLVEYIMRTRGADHLKVSSRNLDFIQFFSLDVIAFLLVLFCVVIYMLIITKRRLFDGLICHPTKEKEKVL
ncbi:UDP-glucuronosyltransferase 2B33-like [Oratosquilla oratoria]|uniref:UDP-glucuronosyltransferase 2B33-like n=1 Tax=Oratosquilla oratoria TaxID=337810 RepID=UPI003F776081